MLVAARGIVVRASDVAEKARKAVARKFGKKFLICREVSKFENELIFKSN